MDASTGRSAPMVDALHQIGYKDAYAKSLPSRFGNVFTILLSKTSPYHFVCSDFYTLNDNESDWRDTAMYMEFMSETLDKTHFIDSALGIVKRTEASLACMTYDSTKKEYTSVFHVVFGGFSSALGMLPIIWFLPRRHSIFSERPFGDTALQLSMLNFQAWVKSVLQSNVRHFLVQLHPSDEKKITCFPISSTTNTSDDDSGCGSDLDPVFRTALVAVKSLQEPDIAENHATCTTTTDAARIGTTVDTDKLLEICKMHGGTILPRPVRRHKNKAHVNSLGTEDPKNISASTDHVDARPKTAAIQVLFGQRFTDRPMWLTSGWVFHSVSSESCPITRGFHASAAKSGVAVIEAVHLSRRDRPFGYFYPTRVAQGSQHRQAESIVSRLLSSPIDTVGTLVDKAGGPWKAARLIERAWHAANHVNCVTPSNRLPMSVFIARSDNGYFVCPTKHIRNMAALKVAVHRGELPPVLDVSLTSEHIRFPPVEVQEPRRTHLWSISPTVAQQLRSVEDKLKRDAEDLFLAHPTLVVMYTDMNPEVRVIFVVTRTDVQPAGIQTPWPTEVCGAPVHLKAGSYHHALDHSATWSEMASGIAIAYPRAITSSYGTLGAVVWKTPTVGEQGEQVCGITAAHVTLTADEQSHYESSGELPQQVLDRTVANVRDIQVGTVDFVSSQLDAVRLRLCAHEDMEAGWAIKKGHPATEFSGDADTQRWHEDGVRLTGFINPKELYRGMQLMKIGASTGLQKFELLNPAGIVRNGCPVSIDAYEQLKSTNWRPWKLCQLYIATSPEHSAECFQRGDSGALVSVVEGNPSTAKAVGLFVAIVTCEGDCIGVGISACKVAKNLGVQFSKL
eukprot:m.450797 g.450797  ORF g.450797 m.450797 type:complete len:849 (+) comp21518_c1_seq1:672-3218(+)